MTGTGKYERFLHERCRELAPIPTAVAHPCEASALAGALEAPTLEDKAHICQNAIDLAVSFGVERPQVAILAAVETVSSKMPATVDAAALCKMSDRGQITGGLLEGPLAFDNAISREAARVKGIHSDVPGDPVRSRIASCAVAMLVAHARRKQLESSRYEGDADPARSS